MITGEVRTIYISSQDNGEQSGTTLHNGIGRKDVKEGLFMLVLYGFTIGFHNHIEGPY